MFIEISDNIPGKGCNLDDWNTSYEGCKCNNICISECSCRPQYHNKKLDVDSNYYQINECNSECICNEDLCLNRIVQNGIKFKLEIYDHDIKGKSVRSLEKIPKGSFICEYMGEIISEEEAILRFDTRHNEPNFIFNLNEVYYHTNETIKTFIDAKNYGNIGRFINHSCEPNLVVVPVRIDNIIPHVAFFAKQDIQENEEITYDYFNGNNLLDNKRIQSKVICLCGSLNCKKFLPSN